MKAENFDVEMLLRMAHSPLRNYVIPGITSWLIGEPSASGTIRMFECERDHQESVTPHSHRFDFQCWVLSGSVRNRLWRATYEHDRQADLFHQSRLVYSGEVGRYEVVPIGASKWCYRDSVYEAGQCYAMEANDIHSIFFSRGSRVLLFEGRNVADSSVILEPWVNGETVPTFKVEPWMFKRMNVSEPHEKRASYSAENEGTAS